MVEASKRLKPWRDLVIKASAKMAETVEPLEGALYVRLEFRVPRPKTVTRAYPITRSSGDTDKLIRGVLDGIDQGGLILDDSQFVDIRASKRYSNNPGVTIYIRPVEETQ
jgi:Holliday junction resolvase RusA-like endonuclease